MGSGWENPGPARQVVIAGSAGELFVYDTIPANGNLILSVAASAGTDPYGNAYLKGLCIYRTTAGDHPINVMSRSGSGSALPVGQIGSSGSSLLVTNNSGPNNAVINISDTGGINVSGGQIGNATISAYGGAVYLNALNIQAVVSNGQFLINVNNNLTFQITQNQVAVQGQPFYVMNAAGSVIFFAVTNTGDIYNNAGPGGKYYTRTATFSMPSVPNATITTVPTTSQQQLNSDYPNAWGGGAFTAPVASYYDVMIFANAVPAATRTNVRIRVNSILYVMNEVAAAVGVTATAIAMWLNAGDVVDFQVLQSSGGTAAMSGNINVARRL